MRRIPQAWEWWFQCYISFMCTRSGSVIYKHRSRVICAFFSFSFSSILLTPAIICAYSDMVYIPSAGKHSIRQGTQRNIRQHKISEWWNAATHIFHTLQCVVFITQPFLLEAWIVSPMPRDPARYLLSRLEQEWIGWLLGAPLRCFMYQSFRC